MLFGSVDSVSAAPAPKDNQGRWAQRQQLQGWLDKTFGKDVFNIPLVVSPIS